MQTRASPYTALLLWPLSQLHPAPSVFSVGVEHGMEKFLMKPHLRGPAVLSGPEQVPRVWRQRRPVAQQLCGGHSVAALPTFS